MIQTLCLEQQEIGCCCFLFFYALQLLRQLVTFTFPHDSPAYRAFHRASVCAVGFEVFWAQPSTAPFTGGSRCVTSLLNDLGRGALSQSFQHDTSTWNDQIGSTQLGDYWLYYFFFFILTLKSVTNPQRGNNKLRKTTYRASSSCGNKVPWTPTICVELLKRDEGCNFVYEESIHN